jgi:hypothetical protein
MASRSITTRFPLKGFAGMAYGLLGINQLNLKHAKVLFAKHLPLKVNLEGDVIIYGIPSIVHGK